MSSEECCRLRFQPEIKWNVRNKRVVDSPIFISMRRNEKVTCVEHSVWRKWCYSSTGPRRQVGSVSGAPRHCKSPRKQINRNLQNSVEETNVKSHICFCHLKMNRCRENHVDFIYLAPITLLHLNWALFSANICSFDKEYFLIICSVISLKFQHTFPWF